MMSLRTTDPSPPRDVRCRAERGARPSRRALVMAALGLFAFSIVLSSIGMTWGLSQRWNPDEMTRDSDLMLHGGPRPRNYHYGSHHKYLLRTAVLPYLAWEQRRTGRPLNELTARPDVHSRVVMICRGVGATLSALAVVLLFIMLVPIMGYGPALASAAVVSALPVRVTTSHFATIDSPLLFWSTLTIFAALVGWRRTDMRWVLAAAFLAGLAAMTKPLGAVVLAPVLWAAWTVSGRLREQGGRPRRRFMATCLVLFVGGCIVGTPQVLTDTRVYLRQMVVFAHVTPLPLTATNLSVTPRGFMAGIGGAPWALLCVAGLIHALRRGSVQQRAFGTMVALWAAVGMGYLLLRPAPGVRHTLLWACFMSPFGLLLVMQLLNRFRDGRRRAAVIALAAGGLLFVGANTAVSQASFLLDPRVRAEEFLAARAEPGDTVETHGPAELRLPAHIRQRPVDEAGPVYRGHPLDTPLAPAFVWLHKSVLRDHDEWLEQHRRQVEEWEAADRRAVEALTAAQLARRAPEWVIVHNETIEHYLRTPSLRPAGLHLTELIAGRLGYSPRAVFGPPLPFGPQFVFPPTQHMTVYVLQRSDRVNPGKEASPLSPAPITPRVEPVP